jgi:hypothetical protein
VGANSDLPSARVAPFEEKIVLLGRTPPCQLAEPPLVGQRWMWADCRRHARLEASLTQPSCGRVGRHLTRPLMRGGVRPSSKGTSRSSEGSLSCRDLDCWGEQVWRGTCGVDEPQVALGEGQRRGWRAKLASSSMPQGGCWGPEGPSESVLHGRLWPGQLYGGGKSAGGTSDMELQAAPATFLHTGHLRRIIGDSGRWLASADSNPIDADALTCLLAGDQLPSS